MRASFLYLFSNVMSRGPQVSNAPEFQHYSMQTPFLCAHHVLLVSSKLKDKLARFFGSVCAREKEGKPQNKRERERGVCVCV